MSEILKTNIIEENQTKYIGEVVLLKKSDLEGFLMSLSVIKKYLTVDEAAKYLSISRKQIYNLRAGNKIPYYKLEGKILFKISELDKFIEKNKVESLSELIQKAKNGGR